MDIFDEEIAARARAAAVNEDMERPTRLSPASFELRAELRAHLPAHLRIEAAPHDERDLARVLVSQPDGLLQDVEVVRERDNPLVLLVSTSEVCGDVAAAAYLATLQLAGRGAAAKQPRSRRCGSGDIGWALKPGQLMRGTLTMPGGAEVDVWIKARRGGGADVRLHGPEGGARVFDVTDVRDAHEEVSDD